MLENASSQNCRLEEQGKLSFELLKGGEEGEREGKSIDSYFIKKDDPIYSMEKPEEKKEVGLEE